MRRPAAGTGSKEHEGRQRSFGQDGGSPLDDLIFRLRARRTLQLFPATAIDVADLGSGHEYRLLRHLYRRGLIRKGIAVDVSLEQAPWPGAASIRLLEADLGEPLDVPDGSVDVVLSLAVLEHMARPQVHLREAHRILRSPGILMLTSPSRASQPLLEFLAFRLHVIDADEIRDHRHYFNQKDVRELLLAAGFGESDVTYRTFLLGLNQFVVARKR